MESQYNNGYLALVAKELDEVRNLPARERLSILEKEARTHGGANPSLSVGCSQASTHYTGEKDMSVEDTQNETGNSSKWQSWDINGGVRCTVLGADPYSIK